MKKKIYLAMCFVFLLMFICSAVGIGITLNRYKQIDKTYSELQENYVIQVPNETEQAPISVDFDALTKENGDIIGWLYCEDTPIQYPVVQSDDNDYYLRRDLHGEYLSGGTLFADYRCQGVGTDQNFIIYGHNMKNSTMFGTLEKYKQQSYYEEHPVLYYLTADADYKIELFAGLVTKSDSKIYSPSFGDTQSFESVLQGIKEKSTFNSDVTVTGNDHIVTLSTCSYEFNNARYVVFGKLTRLSASD